MTEEQAKLVYNLRHELARYGYPAIYAVDNETLTAAEMAIMEELERQGLDPIIKVGDKGVFYKNVQLVLKV